MSNERSGSLAANHAEFDGEFAQARERQSTLRRKAVLAQLVRYFLMGELDQAGVAGLLGCSPSGARNYVHQLLHAQIIVPAASTGGRQVVFPRYRISTDMVRVSAFLGSLSRSSVAGTSSGSRHRRGSVLVGAGRLRHVIVGDATPMLSACDEQVRRDPLVAALFGPAPRYTVHGEG